MEIESAVVQCGCHVFGRLQSIFSVALHEMRWGLVISSVLSESHTQSRNRSGMAPRNMGAITRGDVIS